MERSYHLSISEEDKTGFQDLLQKLNIDIDFGMILNDGSDKSYHVFITASEEELLYILLSHKITLHRNIDPYKK